MRTFLICLSALAQIALSVSPFIPFVKNNIWAPQTSVSGFATALATYVGLQFVCLGVLVYLLLDDFKSQAQSQLKGFEDSLRLYSPLNVRELRESEFYKDFLGQCVRANHYVNICYFSPRPPAVGGSKERVDYYERIASVMKRNPNTRFRRLIRDTPANRKWALQLIEELRGTHNCYIGMLTDYDNEVEMGRALSVQLVDDRIAWLVAIAEHGGPGLYRDVAIENPEVASMLNKYFERLWKLSRIVFEPGMNQENSTDAIYGSE